jgi:hypothetical protein
MNPTHTKQSKLPYVIAGGVALLVLTVVLIVVTRGGGSAPAQFGQQQDLGNGITITVSQPKPDTGTGYTLPEPNKRAVVATITVANNSRDVFDTGQLQAIATANDQMAGGILVDGTSMVRPSVPPGRKVTYKEAWMVPTQKPVPFRLEVSAGYDQDPVFYEGQA